MTFDILAVLVVLPVAGAIVHALIPGRAEAVDRPSPIANQIEGSGDDDIGT